MNVTNAIKGDGALAQARWMEQGEYVLWKYILCIGMTKPLRLRLLHYEGRSLRYHGGKLNEEILQVIYIMTGQLSIEGVIG